MIPSKIREENQIIKHCLGILGPKVTVHFNPSPPLKIGFLFGQSDLSIDN